VSITASAEVSVGVSDPLGVASASASAKVAATAGAGKVTTVGSEESKNVTQHKVSKEINTSKWDGSKINYHFGPLGDPSQQKECVVIRGFAATNNLAVYKDEPAIGTYQINMNKPNGDPYTGWDLHWKAVDTLAKSGTIVANWQYPNPALIEFTAPMGVDTYVRKQRTHPSYGNYGAELKACREAAKLHCDST